MSVSSSIVNENPGSLLCTKVVCDDEVETPFDYDNDQEFPTTSIRVLLVDADSSSLLSMKNLMTQFSYQVTRYEKGEDAIAFLMESKDEIDLVLWDFHLPTINGLQALKTVGKDMDLPVVTMSRDHKKETVIESIKNGACDFLVKPVSKESIAVLWRHVFHKKMLKYGLDNKPDESDSVEDDDGIYHSNEDGVLEGSKNGEDSEEQNASDKSSSKKRRMTWTSDLHHKFEKVVHKIGGVEKAVPKQILKCMKEEMNVEGLTRNNVASHLQKYRLGANKKSRLVPQNTQEDFSWNSTTLAVSKPVLNGSINFQYFSNDQTAANVPMQYPSSSYQTLNNNNNNNYITNDFGNNNQFYHPRQHHYFSSIPLPALITKQQPAATEISDYQFYDPTLPFDPDDFYHLDFTNLD